MSRSHFKLASENLFLIATAWHEAAHTICYLYHLKIVENVNIIFSKDQFGLTSTNSFDFACIHDRVLRKILIQQELQALYAGLIGEKIYYKEICGSDVFPMHLKSGSSSDTCMASELIRKFDLATPGKETVQLKVAARKEAKKILNTYWNDVRLIAHMLFKYKSLDFSEIKYFLTNKSKNKQIWKEKFKRIHRMYFKEELSNREIKQIIKNKS